ncbi:ornithine carbamoyltransferase [Tepidibacillus marianensis]|uniref:ornithine carbamoyltransferase n=1 Tax=Tepidibacillus marianensis TaxID=3131995 RepID=UPI0030D0CC35
MGLSKDFLTLADFTAEEVKRFIFLGLEIKEKQKNGISYQPLQGKTLGMIFEKSSTRTRVSFEVGMLQLGGHALFLSQRDIQIGRGETISDTARVLSRYVDGIMMRTDDQQKLVEMAKYSTVPIINGLSDLYHPTQAIADFMTVYEQKGQFQGLKLTYLGDGNNVAHSLLIGGAKLGMNIVIASPEGYQPKKEIVQLAQVEAGKSGGSIFISTDPKEAIKNADVVYTDVWASMGQEVEKQLRKEIFHSYQVNQELVEGAKTDYIFMHCLPAYRELEVTEEILEGKHSVVFDEAENRLHAHKSIMVALMGK